MIRLIKNLLAASILAVVVTGCSETVSGEVVTRVLACTDVGGWGASSKCRVLLDSGLRATVHAPVAAGDTIFRCNTYCGAMGRVGIVIK